MKLTYYPVPNFNYRLRHPFTCMFNGPTGCGKTYFMRDFLLQADVNITPPPTNLIYCYKNFQEIYNEIMNNAPIANIQFHEGKLVEAEMNFDKSENNLLVMDDLMADLSNDSIVRDLFLRGSHHDNISVIVFTQNLFYDRSYRNLSLNAHYFFLFKSPRGLSQVKCLASQSSVDTKEAAEAYMRATEKPYNYLLVNFHPETPSNLSMMTHLFSADQHTLVHMCDYQFNRIKKDAKTLTLS